MQNTLKIAHAADFHIGSECRSLGSVAAKRKFEVKNSLHKILNVCKEEKVDVLLIAGDLFDDVSVPKNLVEEIKAAFSQVNFPIIISPGNHDPYTEDSPYNGIWSENVLIFKSGKMDFFEIKKPGIRIWGAAFTNPLENMSFLEGFRVPNADFINICVMHGNLASGEESYNLITKEGIFNSGFNYLALGHIHKRTKPENLGNTCFAYSGCPEGRGFDETGSKGFYICEISKVSCSLEFRETCIRKNEILEIDVSEETNDFNVYNKILKISKDKFGENFKENLYKIILTGEISENINLSTENIKSMLNEELFFSEVVDKTKIAIDIQKLSFRRDLRGVFVKKVMEKIKNETELEILENALKLGLKAFIGEVKFDDN